MRRFFLKSWWNFFFPQECLFCGKEDFSVCPKCAEKIPLSLQRTQTPFLKELLVLSDYHHPFVQKTIEAFKFHHGRGIAHDLRIFLAKAAPFCIFPENSCFVPIPLHFLRSAHRGFSQSLLLAEEFSSLLGHPVRELLQKTRWTAPQSHLSKEDREHNIQGSFAPTSAALLLSKDTPLILIDDVGTTLSTLHEAAKVLRSIGFFSLSGLVLARSQT